MAREVPDDERDRKKTIRFENGKPAEAEEKEDEPEDAPDDEE